MYINGTIHLLASSIVCSFVGLFVSAVNVGNAMPVTTLTATSAKVIRSAGCSDNGCNYSECKQLLIVDIMAIIQQSLRTAVVTNDTMRYELCTTLWHLSELPQHNDTLDYDPTTSQQKLCFVRHFCLVHA